MREKSCKLQVGEAGRQRDQIPGQNPAKCQLIFISGIAKFKKQHIIHETENH
jgi:hypothetical protein